jgi:hypothetical protein
LNVLAFVVAKAGAHMNLLKASVTDSTPYDAGTLWTMRQSDKRARCALLAWPAEWELRIVVDGRTLQSQRCPRGADAFALAERWKERMVEHDWTPIVPPALTTQR